MYMHMVQLPDMSLLLSHGLSALHLNPSISADPSLW